LAPLAVSVTEEVGQIPPVVDAVFATVSVGIPLLTVIVTWAEDVQLDGLVAVRLYTVVALGVTTIDEVLAPVLQE
jgi:hypothetical protein